MLTRLSVVAKNCLVKLARRDLKVVPTRDVVDPKNYPNKVHTGPRGSKCLLCSPGKMFGEWPTHY